MWWNRLEWTSVTLQRSMGIVTSSSWWIIFQNGETDQGQISSDYRSIFVRGHVSAWVLWNSNLRQGREFVNEVCKQLYELTGTEQRVTSAYHPLANGLVERQNRTINNSLVKVLEDNPEMWPLFAHRVSPHSSIKYSPFMLMYNREPVLPIDVKHNLDKDESKERENI